MMTLCFPLLKRHWWYMWRRTLPLELWQESPADLPHLPVYAKALQIGGWILPIAILTSFRIEL